MDLRDRLARVAAARAVLREVEERTSAGGGGRADGPAGGGLTVTEQRLDLRRIGLEIVGLAAPDPLTLAHLGLRGDPPKRWEDVLFLDTETTGLSGGAGTYVFLLGTAWVEDGDLVLRQHLLTDLAHEHAYVRAIHAELDRFRACASYNGKAFDLPILRTRVVLAMRGELRVDESHLDLLHPARRLWKDRFGSTTLRQLEASILDDPRGNDDVAGALIPDRYFHWLRTGDDRLIEPVLRHNARDVISLVRIADRVARAVADARRGRAPDHAPAALALARIFQRHGEDAAAYWCYESAYVEGDATIRARASLPFARALERRGEVERAITMLETLLTLGAGPPTWREQAEARLRRLTKVRWRRQELATAS
jgi:uncharacterized protein YprB with RNaseH-like and TPR domain